MVTNYGLREVLIPEEDDASAAKCNIFMSPDFNDSAEEADPESDSAMVLIQGTGQVRAGVWARSVCINESFEKGSMLP
jgi:hypothetical protein